MLDEPANHLDIDSRAQLIQSLNVYEGAVIIISHDRRLLETVVDRLWLVDKATVSTYDGSLEDYRQLQLEKNKPPKKHGPKPVNEKKQSRKDAAEARKRIAPLKKAYEKLDADIGKCQIDLKAVDARLSVSDLFTTNPELAVKLGQNRVALIRLIKTLEDDWLTAMERYEAAQTIEDLDY